MMERSWLIFWGLEVLQCSWQSNYSTAWISKTGRAQLETTATKITFIFIFQIFWFPDGLTNIILSSDILRDCKKDIHQKMPLYSWWFSRLTIWLHDFIKVQELIYLTSWYSWHSRNMILQGSESATVQPCNLQISLFIEKYNNLILWGSKIQDNRNSPIYSYSLK